jgi:hypothetical protein
MVGRLDFTKKVSPFNPWYLSNRRLLVTTAIEQYQETLKDCDGSAMLNILIEQIKIPFWYQEEDGDPDTPAIPDRLFVYQPGFKKHDMVFHFDPDNGEVTQLVAGWGVLDTSACDQSGSICDLIIYAEFLKGTKIQLRFSECVGSPRIYDLEYDGNKWNCADARNDKVLIPF